MKIAVDLDGVCYEWQRTYRYMMREYRGITMPPVEEFWHYWNAPDQFTSKEDRKWMWSEGVRLGLFRYGHMMTGCRLALTQLAETGHQLSIATHRPTQAVNDTLEWLAFYMKDIPLEGVHILSNNEPKTVVKADVLIDDKPENLKEWADSVRWAICFDQPWNRGEGVLGSRAYGWPGVLDKVDLIDRIKRGD